jgi:hypothetical protein
VKFCYYNDAALERAPHHYGERHRADVKKQTEPNYRGNPGTFLKSSLIARRCASSFWRAASDSRTGSFLGGFTRYVRKPEKPDRLAFMTEKERFELAVPFCVCETTVV